MSKTMGLYPNGTEDREATVAVCRRRISLLELDRQRIKRDLHDGILQSLYSVGLNMAAAKLLMTPAQLEATGQVDLASAQLDHAIREIRQFLNTDLGTHEEEEEPLELQMRAVVENITRTVPVTCQVELDPRAIELIPKEYRRQILYILRECMSNCVRHAQPNAMMVSLTTEAGGEVRLVVEDDGTGFIYRETDRRRHGLKNLTTRANQIGGRLCISSIPGHGTRMMLKLGRGVPSLQSGIATIAKQCGAIASS
ncbi:MAG: histidine kinase [Nitrospirota bacterium]|nr:histidine kinase [Nitrospirota bacterium]